MGWLSRDFFMGVEPFSLPLRPPKLADHWQHARHENVGRLSEWMRNTRLLLKFRHRVESILGARLRKDYVAMSSIQRRQFPELQRNPTSERMGKFNGLDYYQYWLYGNLENSNPNQDSSPSELFCSVSLLSSRTRSCLLWPCCGSRIHSTRNKISCGRCI